MMNVFLVFSLIGVMDGDNEVNSGELTLQVDTVSNTRFSR